MASKGGGLPRPASTILTRRMGALLWFAGLELGDKGIAEQGRGIATGQGARFDVPMERKRLTDLYDLLLRLANMGSQPTMAFADMVGRHVKKLPLQ